MPWPIPSSFPLSCSGLCASPPFSLISIVKLAAAAQHKKSIQLASIVVLYHREVDTVLKYKSRKGSTYITEKLSPL